jgi:hypothetical protein
MANVIPLPDGKKVSTLLEALFDGLDVKPGGSFDQSPTPGAWFGVFVLDAGETAALCGTDAALSASFGAALSMLPVAAAQEATKAKNLTDVMVGNIREVMNICSRLLMDSNSPHLKLEELYPRKALPASAAGLLAAPKAQIQFKVSLPKYGGGVMTFQTL